MFRRLLVCVVCAISAWAGLARACSQCVCGMPFPPDALGGPAPARVRLGLEERYLSKQNALEDAPGLEREDEHHVGGWAIARVSSRVLLLARLPWVFKQITEEPAGEAPATARANSVGDAELTALVKVREIALGGERRALLSVLAGARLPTGSNQLRDGTGDRLEEHLQPGSGAWSGIVGADLALRTPAGRVDLNASLRANGGNSEHYRYGDVLLYNVGFARRLGSVLELSLQANGRTAEDDRTPSGTLVEHTGGTVVYASPTVRWFAGAGLMLEAGAQFPFTSDLHGEQQEHATARLALSLAP